MRLHPKRRASTDHAPGPNIARAAPKVAIMRHTNLCAGAVKRPQISVRATRVPTIGVYRPTISRIPAAARRMGTTALAMGGSASIAEAALPTRTIPTTKRIRIRPMPGRPPANVEYKRRNGRTFHMHLHFRRFHIGSEPHKVGGSSLFRGAGQPRLVVTTR